MEPFPQKQNRELAYAGVISLLTKVSDQENRIYTLKKKLKKNPNCKQMFLATQFQEPKTKIPEAHELIIG